MVRPEGAYGTEPRSAAPNDAKIEPREIIMVVNPMRRLVIAAAILVLLPGLALAQGKMKVSIAVGGAGCLCYLPTMLAKQLGEYDKAGLDVELINFKGGSQALTAVLGGSADVVSGYFDHCVNLAAKQQFMQAIVVYDRYPGFALVVAPSTAAASSRSRTWPARRSVSAPRARRPISS